MIDEKLSKIDIGDDNLKSLIVTQADYLDIQAKLKALFSAEEDKNNPYPINGRELYNFLGIVTDYRKWFPRYAEHGRLFENQDFKSVKIDRVQQEGNRTVTRTIENHYLTLDAAKIIASLQKNELGDIVRRYLIWAEKKLHKMAQIQLTKPMTPLEILKQQVVIMENHEKRLASLENKVVQLRDKDNGIILRQQKINIDHQDQLDRHEADITELKTVMSNKGPAESVKVLISDIVRITAETEKPYSYQDAYKVFYDQLRRDHKINIAARVTALKKRKADEGWTNTKIRQISCLDAVIADPLIWDKVRQTVDYIRQCLTETYNSSQKGEKENHG